MISHEKELSRLLLEKYQRSGHLMLGKNSNKRIALSFTRKEYPEYKENDYDAVSAVHKAVSRLEALGIVTSAWRKGYKDQILDKIYLDLSPRALNAAYKIAGMTPITDYAVKLSTVLSTFKPSFETPWLIQFISDELQNIDAKFKTSRLLPDDARKVSDILTVFSYTEKTPGLLRVASVNCFKDSKYIERELLSHIISIARAYEPVLVKNRFLEKAHLPESAVLAQVGLITYPEIIEFCGNVRICFGNVSTDTSQFKQGFCLQSDNINNINKICIDGIDNILFIENRTNYRHIVLRGIPENQLVFLHGGFFSPLKKKLMRLIADNIKIDTMIHFWGDIDLGGFLMLTRLKQELFPELQPYRMGVFEFKKYKSFGRTHESDYFLRLQELAQSMEFQPYHECIEQILNEKVTVEQEIML